MRRLALALLVALVPCAAEARAAGPQVARSAPRETAVLQVAGGRVAVEYGRPTLRGRRIFGVLVPWGEVWRTGADEATKLTTDVALRFAGFEVPPGEYALFTVPGPERWQLVVNRVADQWGAFNYDPRADLGRAELRRDLLDSPLERLSIALHGAGENAATLWIGWERTLLSLRFEAVPRAPPVPAQ